MQAHITANTFRDDFEVIDTMGNCRGFVWSYEGHWCIRVDKMQTSYKDTFEDATKYALELIQISKQ